MVPGRWFCSIPMGAVMMVLGSSPAGGSQVLLETDFTDSVPVHRSSLGDFEGVLPPGCVPAFGWNQSVVTSELRLENGQGFLRVTPKAMDGWVQFGWDLKLRVPGLARATVTYRTPSGELKMIFTQGWDHYWYEIQQGKPGEWNTLTLLCHLDGAAAQQVKHYFFPGLEGLDLAYLKVESFTPEEETALLAADAKTYRRPAPGTANFLRNTRFPLGGQAGWGLRPIGSTDVTMRADTTQRGPSGSPALAITSRGQGAVYSEPFQVADPLASDNRLSFSFKGSDGWRLQVYYLKGSRRIKTYAIKQLPAADTWSVERVDLKLEGDALNARAFGLEFFRGATSGAGTLYLDSMQVWQGDADRPYHPQCECEVALGLPDSPTADIRVQYADEPAHVAYCVTGAKPGSALRFLVVNMYGQEKALADIALTGEEEQSGTVRIDVFPATPLGQFRVEGWVERDGTVASARNEYIVTRIRRPVYLGKDAPDSAFGCHFEASPCMVRLAKSAGMNWVRLLGSCDNVTNWAWVEPEKGKWVFDDEAVDSFRKGNILILGGLNSAPPWASFYQESGKKTFAPYHDAYYIPRSLEDWANYVRKTTEHYRGRINQYFVWNEPWGGFWLGGGARAGYSGKPAEDFTKLQVAAYKAAKEVAPAIVIAGFNSTTLQVGSTWNDAVYRSGGYDHCDALDFHNYIPLWADQAQPGDMTGRALETALGTVLKQVKPPLKPIYMSEGQGIMSTTYGLYKQTLVWDAPSAANAVRDADKAARYLVANLAAGAAKVFLYSAHAYGFLMQIQNLLALIGPDGYPNLEYAATSNLTWTLEDARFYRTIPLSREVNAYVFAGGRERSVAAVSGFRTARLLLRVPADCTAYDLFGNPLASPPQYSGLMLYISSTLSAAELAEALTGK